MTCSNLKGGGMGYDLINKVIPLGREGEVVLRSNTGVGV